MLSNDIQCKYMFMFPLKNLARKGLICQYLLPLSPLGHVLWWPLLKLQSWYPGVLFNIRYPSETHLKLKSRENSFVNNIHFNCPIGLKFCTEHGNDTAVLCAQFQSDWSTEAWVMGKRDFARFELKMNFGRIAYIAQGPWHVVKSLQLIGRSVIVKKCYRCSIFK